MYDAMMLDIGGTFVKYGGMQAGCFACQGQFSIRQEGSRAEIIGALADFLRAHPAKQAVLCMPGPMDYATGTSRMTHKFAALNGVSLIDSLEAQLPGTKVAMLHDGVAFLLGEMVYGGLRGVDCGVGIMLGTGLGFGLCRHGRVLTLPVRTPLHPLWNAPWQGGQCEDYVSGRALAAQWIKQTGEARSVKEIAALARTGDAQAQRLFADAGRNLGAMLQAHVKAWPVEKAVIGGQIAKSWDLFAPAYAETCDIPTTAAEHLEDAALWGDYAYAAQGEKLLQICGDA